MKIDFLNGPKVTISATPDEWELYGADTPEQEQDRDFVADALNRGVETLIAHAPTRRDINYKHIDLLLSGYRAWGAADTEGHYMVERILEKVYGDE